MSNQLVFNPITGKFDMVNVQAPIALDDLTDVTIASPALDQILKYNGSVWVNGSQTSVNAGSGVDFFPNSTNIATGPSSDTTIETLSKSPDTSVSVTDSRAILAASSPLAIGSYLYNFPIGGTQIDSGIWDFDIWASTSNATGNNFVLANIFKTILKTGTVTTTGTLTTRTVTASAGSTFVAGDASSNHGNCSYLQTPSGLFPITAFVSDTVVTITTPAGYSDESTVAFSIWKKLFQVSSNNLTTSFSLSTVAVAQPAFSLGATDKLGIVYLGSVSSGTHTISYIHDGMTQYTHFNTPLVIRHNDLAGLQGGTSGEYNHLTNAQLTVVGNTSGTNTGNQTGGTPALVLGTANTAGTSPNFIRRDDTILAFDATAPSTQAYGDSALVGTATVAARRDHKHAMPATVKDTTGVTGILKGNGSAISAAVNSDLPAMSATVGGAVPTPPNNTTTFLRGDGTFAAPSGSSPLPTMFVTTSTIWGGNPLNTGWYSDNRDYWSIKIAVNAFNAVDMTSGGDFENHVMTTENANSQTIQGIAKIGSYVYVCVSTTDSSAKNKVYRFASNNITAGGTLMTISGTALGDTITGGGYMISNGTSLFFGDAGMTGGGASLHVFAKYSISGTTLTYVSSTTCGSTSGNFLQACMDSAGNFYGIDTTTIRRYNTSGTIQATSTNVIGSAGAFMSIEGTPYIGKNDSGSTVTVYYKTPLLA